MLREGKDDLVCDLAETYGIHNMRALPVSLLATLASGLRENSRIKMRLSGSRIPRSEMLLAATVDRLSQLIWMLSEDGRNGTNPPKFILDALMGNPEINREIEAYDSAEEFEEEWARRTGVSHGR